MWELALVPVRLKILQDLHNPCDDHSEHWSLKVLKDSLGSFDKKKMIVQNTLQKKTSIQLLSKAR